MVRPNRAGSRIASPSLEYIASRNSYMRATFHFGATKCLTWTDGRASLEHPKQCNHVAAAQGGNLQSLPFGGGYDRLQ
jgi:hypothetical protein